VQAPPRVRWQDTPWTLEPSEAHLQLPHPVDQRLSRTGRERRVPERHQRNRAAVGPHDERHLNVMCGTCSRRRACLRYAGVVSLAQAGWVVLIGACRRGGYRPHLRHVVGVLHAANCADSARAQVTYRALHPPPERLETALAWRRDDKSPALAEFIATARRVLIHRHE
jgi:hypothetical protein